MEAHLEKYDSSAHLTYFLTDWNNEQQKRQTELRKERQAVEKKVLSQFENEITKATFEQITVPTPSVAEKIEKGIYDNDLTTKTVKMMNTTHVKDRVKLLQEICEISEKTISKVASAPVEGSITTSEDPNKQAVLSMFEEVEASQQLCDTAPMEDVLNTAKMIENITGYDVITKKKTPMIELYISSTALENKNVLYNDPESIKAALRKDLAAAYGVKEEEINIRIAVAGSVKLLFSLPEKANSSAVIPSLPTFSSILKTVHGIADQVKVVAKQVLPDIKKAMQLMKDYTSPLVISSGSTKSELMTKFGKYLPVLASLSNHLRVVHNEAKGELEIHGPPEAKGNILSYFADLEDSLQDATVKTVTISLDPPLQAPKTNANALWKFLFEKGKEFVVNGYANPKHTLQQNTIRINSELEKDCPVGQKFLNALKKLNLNPSNPNEIYQRGVPFGWHGTRTPEAVAAVSHENLDPGRRRGQAYGKGEYCSINPAYSQGGYWGNTRTLFLFFIIKDCPFYTFNTHHVVNNPSKDEMYMVPILLATFDTQSPLKIECQSNPPPVEQNKVKVQWEWWNDTVWIEYGKGQPVTDNSQIALESAFAQFKTGSGNTQMLMAFVRLNDKNTSQYLINFQTKTQINQGTNFVRKIRRLVNGAENWELQ